MTREVRTIAGTGWHGLVDGGGESAEFWEPSGFNTLGQMAYIADTNNHAVRALNLDTRQVRTIEISSSA